MGDGTCLHEASTCPVGENDYCSEFCHERAGAKTRCSASADTINAPLRVARS